MKKKIAARETMKRINGFSIIELVVVMAIVAILAAVAIPNFTAGKERAKIQVAKGVAREITAAMDFYSTDNMINHPKTASSTPFFYPDFSPSSGSASCLDKVYEELSLYIKDNPKDILGGSGLCFYSISADRTSYTLTLKANDAQQTPVTCVRRTDTNYKSISAFYQGEDIP